jgi:branched-chain amino acid transport system substrate-binding protein
LDNLPNQEFVKAWHEAYGVNSNPDFMSAQGWDAMHGIFTVIKMLNGNLDDGAKFVDGLKGSKLDGPRGDIQIDPNTHDVIQDEHAATVYRKPDGKLGIKTISVFKAVKDECKELRLGRCGS